MDSLSATRSKGGYFYTSDINSFEKWHLRFGVTPNCNFFCAYCAPHGGFPKKEELPLSEVKEILQAAYNNGIKRVHWTGGEPTYRNDIVQCIGAAKEIGFKEQVITTNGYKIYDILDESIKNGLTRVIVSLDTLNPERFKNLTGFKIMERVVKGVEASVKNLKSPTKVSCCTMRSTLGELKGFVEWVRDVNSRSDNSGKLIMKLNQFFPSNPAQLEEKGESYWRDEFVSDKEILEALANIGDIKPIKREEVMGDNPSYNYYEIGDTGVLVGVLAMFSWKYRCGGCHKLRIKPNGGACVCMDYSDADVELAGKSIDEKTSLLSKAMHFREYELEKVKPITERIHYNEKLGSQRFVDVAGCKKMDEFYKKLKGSD